jgi:hypothetical protein
MNHDRCRPLTAIAPYQQISFLYWTGSFQPPFRIKYCFSFLGFCEHKRATLSPSCRWTKPPNALIFPLEPIMYESSNRSRYDRPLEALFIAVIRRSHDKWIQYTLSTIRNASSIWQVSLTFSPFLISSSNLRYTFFNAGPSYVFKSNKVPISSAKCFVSFPPKLSMSPLIFIPSYSSTFVSYPAVNA